MSNHKEKGKSIDELLNDAGALGFLQIIVHVCVAYISLTNAGHVTLSFFTGHSPSWKCVKSNSSSFCAINFNRTIASDSEMFSKRCNLNRSEWTYTTDTTSSYVTEFDLICEKTSTAALTSAFFHIGCLAGDIISGISSDACGRKVVIIVSSVILPFPTIVSGYISAIWQLHILNFVRGITSAATFYTAYVYLSEVTPPKMRSISSNIFIIFTLFSYLLLDLLAYQSKVWRTLTKYMGILVVPVWGMFFIIPESPRWLLSKGRKDEAEAVIARITSYKGNVKLCIMDSTEASESKQSYSYFHLIKNWEVLRLTICLFALWFTGPILYFTIGKESMGYAGNMYGNFAIITAADFPATLSATIFSKCIGRKIINIGGLLTACVLFGCIPLVPSSFIYHSVIKMTLTILARVACEMALTLIFLWSSELYPTVIRSQGFSVCTIGLKSGMICIPFITTLLQAVSYKLPFIVISVCGILAGLAGLQLPETKGKPTREQFKDIYDRPNLNKPNEIIGIENMSHRSDECLE